jgi:hypothetical protein
MQQIANFFNCKFDPRGSRVTNYGNSSTYFVYTTNMESNVKVYNYFSTRSYPMFSSKYLDFLDWSTVHNHRLSGTHLTSEGALACFKAKHAMNNKRTYFNWDHLNNFPE